MWMSVLEDRTTAAVILIVLTLLGVLHAGVMRVTPDIAGVIAMVSII